MHEHIGTPEHFALWKAIDAVVAAAGGTVSISRQREDAVVMVERAVVALMRTAPADGRLRVRLFAYDRDKVRSALESLGLRDENAQLRAERDELLAVIREVVESIPSTYDSDDPMVRRHARSLNAANSFVARIHAKEKTNGNG